MSNIVHLYKQVETPSKTDKPNLDENLKLIVRELARQAAKEYFESYQGLESKEPSNQNSAVDSTVKTGV